MFLSNWEAKFSYTFEYRGISSKLPIGLTQKFTISTKILIDVNKWSIKQQNFITTAHTLMLFVFHSIMTLNRFTELWRHTHGRISTKCVLENCYFWWVYCFLSNLININLNFIRFRRIWQQKNYKSLCKRFEFKKIIISAIKEDEKIGPLFLYFELVTFETLEILDKLNQKRVFKWIIEKNDILHTYFNKTWKNWEKFKNS